MSEGKRPGGLTALAVINFIAAAYDVLIGFLANIGFLMASQSEGFRDAIRKGNKNKPEEAEKAIEQMDKLAENSSYLYSSAGASLVCGILLLIAGIGYLKQKKGMGRTVGNLYALVSLISLGILVATMPDMGPDAPEGFSMIYVIAGIYPALTLFLLNTTFKDDFIR